MEKNVGVIGGGGHAGFGLCLVLAQSGFNVYGIDINEIRNRSIMQGVVPFREEGAAEVLKPLLATGRLRWSSDVSLISQCDVVVVSVGTPVDEHLNPVLAPLNEVCRVLAGLLRPGQLIILRSTVSPGTTRRVRQQLETQSGRKEASDFHLVVAPERVAQGNALREIPTLPQLVGTFSEAGYRRAEAFFAQFVKNRCFNLEPEEAEIGKLISNTTRYVGFALANEYYLLAERFGVNIHRVLDACNFDYPRLNVPDPGPNVGGPCLYKDGFFLVEALAFPELFSAAFKINESMPHHVLSKIQEQQWVKKVGILGMTFKANSDDTRNSLSFKLRKQLRNAGYEVACYDPHVEAYNHPESLAGCQCLVLMTTHPEFLDLPVLLRLSREAGRCLVVDIWGFWKEQRGRSRNGIFIAEGP